jgi:tight adherence protein B
MSASVLGALALLAAALLAAMPGRSSRRRLREVLDVANPRRLAIRRPPDRSLIALVAGVAAVGGLAAGGPVAGFAGALYGGAGARALVQRRRARAVAAAHRAGIDAVAGLADDLRAGRTPEHALTAAVASLEPAVDDTALRVVAGAAVSGADIVGALDAVRHPGLVAVFGRLATIWRLNDAGVPLAELLDSLEAELRAHRRATERAAAHLAAASATARLLAGLPLVGLVLGFALGVNPLGILLHTVAGGVCAVLAMLLQVGGTVWTERLARSAVAR